MIAPPTDGPADRDCPVCGAIGPDYCRLARCEWNITDPVLHETVKPDDEVMATWPNRCPTCGQQWDRIGFMEWELTCDCPLGEIYTL